ncbi:metallophosphoesterase [Acidothermaceae bacterium B102]|nr:metallophosphoesterase [Acidothermaceae bacterium B102]
MVLLVHLSDTHFDNGPRASERAARVMAYLETLDDTVDAVLVTGDIADHGLKAEYAEALAVLSSRHRVLLCPGNHDVRGPYREVLLGTSGNGPVNALHEVPGAVIAMCDSSVPGEDWGHLEEETLAWLDEELTRTQDRPAFVAFHHPPVMVHNELIDGIRLRNPEPLADLLARHQQVVAVLVGHAHTAAASTFAGRPLLVAPGVASTLLLPWEGRGHLDLELPPAVAFHVLDDGGRVTTHYRVIPNG